MMLGQDMECGSQCELTVGMFKDELALGKEHGKDSRAGNRVNSSVPFFYALFSSKNFFDVISDCLSRASKGLLCSCLLLQRCVNNIDQATCAESYIVIGKPRFTHDVFYCHK